MFEFYVLLGLGLYFISVGCKLMWVSRQASMVPVETYSRNIPSWMKDDIDRRNRLKTDEVWDKYYPPS